MPGEVLLKSKMSLSPLALNTKDKHVMAIVVEAERMLIVVFSAQCSQIFCT